MKIIGTASITKSSSQSNGLAFLVIISCSSEGHGILVNKVHFNELLPWPTACLGEYTARRPVWMADVS
jgi:hypothetical protein